MRGYLNKGKEYAKRSVFTALVGGFPVASGFLVNAILDINTLKVTSESMAAQVKEIKLNARESELMFERRRIELKRDIVRRLDRIERKLDGIK